MTAPVRFRQRDLANALKAAKLAGYEEVRVRIDPAGHMDVLVGKAANDAAPNPLDRLLNG